MARIEVKDGSKGFTITGEIDRTPRRRSGYEVVTYNGCLFQLFGGVRGREFIDVSNPIRCRKK